MPLILCVDDEPSQLTLYRFLFERAGLTVLLANNGQEAIDTARVVQPDLILMDMMMPVKDGCQAAAEIRAIPGLADIPIVLLTAYQPHVLAQQAAASGITTILPKTLLPGDLLTALQAYLPLHAPGLAS